MTSTGEWLPARPRKASAGTRRHHAKRLTWRIRQHIPGAARILATPVGWSENGDRAEMVYVLLVHDADGRRVKAAPEATPRVVALLQGAFPAADWYRPQTWNADSNTLTVWQPCPSYRGRAA